MTFHFSFAGAFEERARELETELLADVQAVLKKYGESIVTSFFNGSHTGTVTDVHTRPDVEPVQESTPEPASPQSGESQEAGPPSPGPDQE